MGKVAYLSVATFEDDRERAMPYQVLAVVLKVPNQFHDDSLVWLVLAFETTLLVDHFDFFSFLRENTSTKILFHFCDSS